MMPPPPRATRADTLFPSAPLFRSGDIGEHDSRGEAEAGGAAVYASDHPGEHVYLDGLFGYQRLSSDLRGHVTANGNTVRGTRDGGQWFASLAAGYQWQHEQLQLTP